SCSAGMVTHLAMPTTSVNSRLTNRTPRERARSIRWVASSELRAPVGLGVLMRTPPGKRAQLERKESGRSPVAAQREGTIPHLRIHDPIQYRSLQRHAKQMAKWLPMSHWTARQRAAYTECRTVYRAPLVSAIPLRKTSSRTMAVRRVPDT